MNGSTSSSSFPARPCTSPWWLSWLLALAAVATLTAGVRGQSEDSTLGTYYEKLAQISPRDATGFFQLATWCESRGLTEQARQLWGRVLKIDPDHAAARAKLGYERYGLEWRRAGETPPPGSEPDRERVSGTGGRVNAGGPPEQKPLSTGQAGETTAEGEAGTVEAPPSYEELVAKKLAWARECASELSIEFNTHDDRDFILHTTYDMGFRGVRQLLLQLKQVRALVQKLLGARSSTLIWPEKIQLFYLREIECVQFAEKILGRRFEGPDGWEAINDHTLLLYEIDDQDLARAAGRASLEGLGGSPQWVNWWLRDGVAELAAAQTESGKKDQLYATHFDRALKLQEKSPDALILLDVLESPAPDRRNREQSLAIAATLVDFLASNRRRFAAFVDDLKEFGGKLAPEDEDSSEFRNFFIEYIGRQEEALQDNYRVDAERLESAWREYTRKVARALEARRPPGGTERGGRGEGEGRRPGRRNRGGGLYRDD